MATEDIGTLLVKIDANTRGLQDGVEKAGSKLTGLGSIVTKIGGVLAAGFAVKSIVSGIKDLTKAAEEQIKAENRLETLAKNVPGTTEAQITALKQLAATQQNLTTIGDEVTIAGQSQLATFQLSTDTIAKLTPAFQDLAVATYGANVSQEQMIQSGNLLGKAMMGNTGALSRVGVSFTDAQAQILKTGNEAQRAATLVEVLGQNFGGLAESTRNTTEGSIIAMKNAWGDMKEVLGNFLLPVLGSVATWFSSKIPTIQDVSTKAFGKIRDVVMLVIDGFKGEGDPKALFGSWEYWIYQVGAAAGILSNGISALTGFIVKNQDVILALAAGIGTAALAFGAYSLALNAMTIATGIWTTVTGIATGVATAFAAVLAFITSPIGIVVLAIGALVAAGILLYKNWDTISAKAKEIWASITDFFTKTIPEKFNQFVTFISELPGRIQVFLWDLFFVKIPYWIGYGIGFMITAVKEGLPKLIQFFADLPGNIAKWLQEMINRFVVWSTDVSGKAQTAGQNIFNGIIDFFKNLPQNAWNWLVAMKDKFVAIVPEILTVAQKLGQTIYDGIIDFVKSIPGKAADLLFGIVDKVKNIASSIKTAISNIGKGAAAGSAAASSAVGHLASGTSNWRGGAAWVGEHGPELLNLPKGSQVIPNNQAMAGATNNYEGMITGNTFVIKNEADIKALAREFYNLQQSKARASGVVYAT
ncbi:MAG: hypothetical protein PHH26_03310 [Candidatus Thermoplasmatota archaeon]|nr:hypothetical protein [Candidatus Thermoplasmatota archaeon]